jgi:transcriptional regulator with XRE-family HTH domain
MSSVSSSSAQAARMALASRLKDLMADRGLSARDLSTAAGWHESKTSRLLNGGQQPSRDDLRKWTEVCGAAETLPELVSQLQSVDTMWLDWRRAERNGLLKINAGVRDLFERTRIFRFYSSAMIPSPVQTAEYVRALLAGVRTRRNLAVDDIEVTIAERMARQHIVYEGDHRFCIVLEESALKTQIGGPRVLAGQLRHLLAIQSLPSMALGVIPASADRSNHWPVEPFFMYDKAQVSVELVSGHLTVTAAQEIDLYVRIMWNAPSSQST